MMPSLCFCQSAYVWTASQNFWHQNWKGVGGGGWGGSHMTLTFTPTPHSQWLAVRRCGGEKAPQLYEGFSPCFWREAAHPCLLEITFILCSSEVVTLDVSCSSPAGDFSCHLSTISSDKGVKWPPNSCPMMKKKLQMHSFQVSFSSRITSRFHREGVTLNGSHPQTRTACG